MKVFSIILLLFSTSLLAQRAAVSEYYNISGNAGAEWTEIIILSDGVDLTDYYLFDNGGDGGAIDGWVGGVQFKDVPLWEDLREGTIIVVNHRGTNAVDDNRRDGYIEISAQNTTYFNQVINISADWTASLAIGQDSDLIALIDGNRYEHILGHKPNYNSPGDLDTLLNKNSLIDNTTLSGRWSVRVTAGTTAGYTGGYDSPNVTAGLINSNNEKGFPNGNANSDLWRSLREPTWNNPNMNINSNGTDLTFNFSSMQNDRDGTQGYLLVAYTKTGGFGQADLPVDGESYEEGDQLSQGSLVLGNTTASSRRIEYSTNKLDCNEDYTFRAYAYRYEDDNQNKDSDPANARGRSYNQSSFAQEEFIFDRPDEPVLVTELNSEVICEGGSLLLSTEDRGFTYEWYYNGNLITDANSAEYLAEQPGRYYVIALGSNGCAVQSEEIELALEANPFAQIRYEGRLMSDTTFRVCEGESIDLRGVGGEEVFWYKDGVKNGVVSNDISISETGTYYIEALNKGICNDFSSTITLQVQNIDLAFDNTDIDFGVTNFVSNRSLTITNNSDSEVIINEEDIEIDDFFDLQNVDFPITIPAGEERTIELVFAPTDPGNYDGKLTISSDCNYFAEILLSGSKPSSEINVSRSNLPFGSNISCDEIENQSFEVSLKDQLPKTILSASFEQNGTPFDLVNPLPGDFPIEINGTDAVPFEVEFAPNVDGNYSNTLTLVISTDGVNPSFEERILVSGSYRIPNMIIRDEQNNELSVLDFGLIDGCEGGFVDGSYIVDNVGGVEIEVTYPQDPRFIITNNPRTTLPVGESELVEFRYTPQNQTEDEVINFTYMPCDLEKTLGFKSETSGFIATTEQNIYDLGDIYPCQIGSEAGRVTIPVTFNGESEDQITYKSGGDVEFYSVSGSGLTDGFVVGETAEFVFELNSDPGNQEIDVRLEFEPCGEVNFKLLANVVDINYDVNPANNSVINFGTIDNGATETRNIVITNFMDTTLVIENPAGFVAPFELTANNPAFPITIEPGSNQTLEVEYFPNTFDATDEIEVTFDVTSPCSEQLEFTLLGETNENDIPANVFISVSDDLTANILNYESFVIPLEINSTEILASELNLTTLDLAISFNGTVFYIIRTNLSEDDNLAIDLSNERFSSGEAAVQIDAVAQLEYGELFTFTGVPTVGNNFETDIEIEILDAEFTGNAVLRTESGKFEITDYCERSVRLIGNLENINLKDGDIIKKSQNISIPVNNNLTTTVQLFDYIGNEYTLLNEVASDTFYEINLNEIPAGAYILRYSIGNYDQSFRVLIID